MEKSMNEIIDIRIQDYIQKKKKIENQHFYQNFPDFTSYTTVNNYLNNYS